MFNLGAPEVFVIAVLALIVLGPTRLPEAARQIGHFMGEIRKLSSGFQREMKAAFEDETEKAARVKGAAAVAAPTEVAEPAVPTPTPRPTKRAEPLKVEPVEPAAPAKKAVAKKAAAKKAVAKKAVAKKAAAKKAAAKTASPKKTAP